MNKEITGNVVLVEDDGDFLFGMKILLGEACGHSFTGIEYADKPLTIPEGTDVLIMDALHGDWKERVEELTASGGITLDQIIIHSNENPGKGYEEYGVSFLPKPNNGKLIEMIAGIIRRRKSL